MGKIITQREIAAATGSTLTDISQALRRVKCQKNRLEKLYEVEDVKKALRTYYERKLADTQASMLAKVNKWEDRLRAVDGLEGREWNG